MDNFTEEERQAQMDDMKSFDKQMPCVGIFWYDPKDHVLFGVRKKELTPMAVEVAETFYQLSAATPSYLGKRVLSCTSEAS